jgi:hypothetical protein
MTGYPLNVLHNLIGMDKDLFVDPLVGVPDPDARLIPLRPEGVVDMTGTEGFGRLEFTINSELMNYIQQK